LFDVVDSFDRFLAGAAHDANRRIVDANLATVQLIAKQLDRALRQAGVEQISALGTVLDSNFHEVVEVRQSKSTEDDFVVEEDDVVVEIVNRGYVWKGITLRPARVVVAAARRGK
jgi:molecular chaperone GrpE (heat shock protein)